MNEVIKRIELLVPGPAESLGALENALSPVSCHSIPKPEHANDRSARTGALQLHAAMECRLGDLRVNGVLPWRSSRRGDR